MYRSSNRTPHKSFAPRRFGGGNRGGGFSRGRPVRRLDPSLFVKKAALAEVEAPYVPMHTFSDFALDERIKANIQKRGYDIPTPIQDQTIPLLLEGKDVIGLAATGTGKTAAFLLPLIHKLLLNPKARVLIVAPTRELAVQIDEEFRKFAVFLKLYSVVCIGGVGMGAQIAGLRRLPPVVIGTPGRLKDLEKQRFIHFGSFETLVLDEVDRMLDMGFSPDVQYIAAKLPRVRHNIFFSATMTSAIEDIIRRFSPDPIRISVNTSRTASANVDQDVIRVNGKPKVTILHELLMKEGFDKVLVFGRTKHGMDKLARSLEDMGVRVASIHGNKSQHQRQRALLEFRQNRVRVLLATDVASRGLDIDSVTHVINYDPPESYDDYIHRIGRTGRADKKGIALTFVD